jgi:hypothetical protein
MEKFVAMQDLETKIYFGNHANPDNMKHARLMPEGLTITEVTSGYYGTYSLPSCTKDSMNGLRLKVELDHHGWIYFELSNQAEAPAFMQELGASNLDELLGKRATGYLTEKYLWFIGMSKGNKEAEEKYY